MSEFSQIVDTADSTRENRCGWVVMEHPLLVLKGLFSKASLCARFKKTAAGIDEGGEEEEWQGSTSLTL